MKIKTLKQLELTTLQKRLRTIKEKCHFYLQKSRKFFDAPNDDFYNEDYEKFKKFYKVQRRYEDEIDIKKYQLFFSE